MKITILGTRGQIKVSAPLYTNHSGMLVDDKFLFDIGEENYAALKPAAIFITHLHTDHAAFVLQPFAMPRIPVYAPECGTYAFIKKSKPLSVDAYRITPIPTRHSLKVKSCAYLIEHYSKRILYTGDLYAISAWHRWKLGRLDCVITEGSFMAEGGMIRGTGHKRWGHTGIPDLIRLFKPHTHHIVLTHFGSWFYKDIARSLAGIAALGEKYNIKLIAAYDGMTFYV